MATSRGQLRRIALALGASTAIVVLVAALLPRGFLINDDPWLTLFLRRGVFTPWISPVLVRVLIAAYHHSPAVPWYGLYQYTLVALSGAVILHTCLELIDPRPGLGRITTLLGASALVASEVLIASGLTWTVVSILSLGASFAALVAHLHLCQTTGRRASLPRALGYGVLATCGYVLRPSGLGAMVAALLPLFGWLAFQLWRGRHLPRVAALVAAIAPLAIVIAIQDRLPPLPGAELDPVNDARGEIHGQAAFTRLDRRAPALLERAGWTTEEYRDFTSWDFIDDQQFTLAKMQRLIDTGGVPNRITAASAAHELATFLEDSPAAVWLFLAGVLGTVMLAGLRVLDTRRGLVFGVGYLVCEIAVPLWVASQRRFPQRVSLAFFVVAALGIFVILAREIAARPAQPEPLPGRARHASVALAVIAVMLFLWARNVIAWTDRPAQGYPPAARGFIAGVDARRGFVLPEANVIDFDPLAADPHGYTALPVGWGTFTGLWYAYLARFGLHHGGEVLPWMINNPDAYLLAPLKSRITYEPWIRRLVGDPAVNLTVVEVTDAFRPGSIALFRLVTQPPVRGTLDWALREHTALDEESRLPRPPRVADLAFRPVTFAAPYARYASDLRRAAAGVALEPIDDGLRCVSAPGPAACATTAERRLPAARETDNPAGIYAEIHDPLPAREDGDHAGIRVEVHGLRAARFELALIDAKNILSVHVHAESASRRSLRWRWDLGPDRQQLGFRGAFTVVPGYGARLLERLGGSASPEDIVALHLYVTVKPGTRAGFEVRHFEVAEAAAAH